MIKVTSKYRKISSILTLFLSSIIILAIVLGSSPLVPQSSFAQQASFGDPVHLDDSQGDQTDAHVASSGDNVYSSYSSEVSGSTSDVLFKKSTDKGASFSDPKTLNDDGHFAFLSDIAAAGDDVYVTWTDVTSESNILLAKSNDNGASFDDPVKVSGTNARSPEVAVFDNNVYVVWQDFSNSPDGLTSDIFFAVSTDSGISFGSPIDVSNTEGTLNRNPSVAAFGDDVYIVWSNCDTNGTNCKILYTKSSNAGSSFITPVVLASPESSLPDVKAFEDKVYIVYGQSQFVNGVQVRDVFLIKSTYSGSTFSSPINLSISLGPEPNPNPNQIGRSANPHIDLSGDNVAVTWDERVSPSNPHSEVFFVGSTNEGSTFSEPISISGSLGDGSTLNDVTISGTNVYSTWNTLEEDFNVYFVAGTVTPLTPEEGIEKLVDTINNMNLKKSIKTSLTGPLHNAIKLLTDNNPTNDMDVCSKIDSFITQVNAKEANLQLTSQQAADLRQQATGIEISLGCPSPSPLVSRSSEADKSSDVLVLPH